MSGNTIVLTSLNLASPVEQVGGYNVDLETGASTDLGNKKWGAGSTFLNPPGDGGNGGVIVIEMPYTDLAFMGTGDSTVEFWAYITNNSVDQYLYGWFEPSTFAGWGFECAFNGTSLYISNYSDPDAVFLFGVDAPASPFIENTWIHVAIVMEGTKVRVFVNGNYFDERSLPNRFSLIQAHIDEPNTRGWCFGGDNDTWTLSGNIDDIRVSNVARYTGSGTYTVPPAEFTYVWAPELLQPNDANIEELTEVDLEFDVINLHPDGPFTFQWLDALTGQPPPNLSTNPRQLRMEGVTQAQEGTYYCTYDNGTVSGQSRFCRVTVRPAPASLDFDRVILADDWGRYSETLDGIYTVDPGEFDPNIANARTGYSESMLDESTLFDGQPTLSTGQGVSSSPRNGNEQSLELDDFTLSINFRITSIAGGERTLFDFGED